MRPAGERKSGGGGNGGGSRPKGVALYYDGLRFNQSARARCGRRLPDEAYGMLTQIFPKWAPEI